MIQMGDFQSPPLPWRKTVKQIEQDHGIDAARDSNKDTLAWRQETPCSDVLANLRQEINHTAIVPVRLLMCQPRERCAKPLEGLEAEGRQRETECASARFLCPSGCPAGA